MLFLSFPSMFFLQFPIWKGWLSEPKEGLRRKELPSVAQGLGRGAELGGGRSRDSPEKRTAFLRSTAPRIPYEFLGIPYKLLGVLYKSRGIPYKSWWIPNKFL